MSTEVDDPPPLFEAILTVLATEDTAFDTANCPDASTLVLRSERCGDLVIVVTTADTDPHSSELIQAAHQRAREHDTSLFATANPTDLFVFAPTETEVFHRRHYDLRDSTLERFVTTFLDDPPAPESSFEEFLLGRLRSFYTSLATLSEELIAERFGHDEPFRGLLSAWATDHDYPSTLPDAKETFRAVARQYAYRCLNRILCYELLRRRTDNSLGSLAGDAPIRDEQFAAAVDVSGCDRLFRMDDAFLQAVSDDERTRRRRCEFIESLEAEPLERLDSDILGPLYEILDHRTEQIELGEFYTPDAVARILSGWAVESAADRILDPCSGSGALTVGAARRLGELDDGTTGEITAVDIEAFPIQLTALNHLVHSRSTVELSTHCTDLFDLEPVATDGDQLSDSQSKQTAIGQFDATVANPPYVRQEKISGERERLRAHLSEVGSGSDEIQLDRRCDLYCYFLTHTTRFLHDGARLAWIIPTKWLTADYGPSVRRFLFDHYSVEAIVGFRTSLFEDALVDTVLLLAEKCDSEPDRLATNTSFVQVTGRLSPDDVLALVERDTQQPVDGSLTVEHGSHSRTLTVQQSSLVERVDRKLQPYLTAPTVYLRLIEHDGCVPLSEVATISRGVKTGANPIFFLDSAAIDAHGIDPSFCRPAVKTVRAIESFEYTAADAGRWLLDLHGYVTGLADSSPDSVRETLRAAGYNGVLSYLSWAREQPARENKSLDSYEPWFDLGALDGEVAPIICPQAMDTRRRFVRTDCTVVPSNRFLLVEPAPEIDETLLLGLLNATLSQIVVESHGRLTGGGAINLSGSDLEEFLLPDPAAVSAEQATAISRGFERLANGDPSGRDAIDRAVIEALGLDVSVEELQTLSRTLKRRRRSNGAPADSLLTDTDTAESRLELSLE